MADMTHENHPKRGATGDFMLFSFNNPFGKMSANPPGENYCPQFLTGLDSDFEDLGKNGNFFHIFVCCRV